ncbi:LLM class flavin-dependent oxidoreductase [Actinoplanes sp. N902-109]|uniref:LLM class flavin-dependent oxidoreductase n=1 Tax=Actinoplanes sp. (strain N902-109) TaxID=649831 RepID=UPI00032955F0|nr:LLM class flavin-dependent oxidoreductase [Actinoplanes sp. N902-109]AGL17346.1 luciferase-like monooxygenase [Actinoplanes sp. N902-109]
MSAKEYGVFLPIGNGGWMLSGTAPHPEATYAYNRRVAVDAEQIGLDFIMSMAKWKGFGGSTDHWGQTLESMTLMSALAEATSRVRIWATMHANIHHPAIAAKMFTTLQDVSAGRAGMNIVNGSYAAEFEQMGLWDPALSHAERYRMTEEWTQAVTRLWTEDSVTMKSDFFTLDECESRPHPATRPAIISAGRSEPGRRFQARYADGAFLSADNLDQMRDFSRSVHDMAAGFGRTVHTYSMLTVVLDDTDDAAAAKAARYSAGLDTQALINMRTSWGIPAETARAWAEGATGTEAFQTPYVTGNADTVTAHIQQIMAEAELDGLMLIFPDYHADLLPFGETVLPALRAAE